MAKKKVKKTAEAKLQRRPNIIIREDSAGGFSILNPSSFDSYVKVDGVAAEAWSLINGQRTKTAILLLLQKKYPKHAAQVPARLDSWIKNFQKHGLLK